MHGRQRSDESGRRARPSSPSVVAPCTGCVERGAGFPGSNRETARKGERERKRD